jgi:5-methyltetrahydrofolate--homocysteine methyltransferase
VKAGLLGIEEACAQAGWRLPAAVSVTIETTGTMLAGQDAEALAVSLSHADILYVGLNCATGPELMRDHLRTLSELCRTRVACVPNAGCRTRRAGTEGRRFREFSRFLDAGWLNLVGGCCGTRRRMSRPWRVSSLGAGRVPYRTISAVSSVAWKRWS